jgi:PIN domain nuclease of toxin-antitoxin system
MRMLLDTHIFLWAVTGSKRLAPDARRLLEAADYVHVSAASIWEIAIKARLGRIDADPRALAEIIEPSGFLKLPVKAAHAAVVAELPAHHGDPFDRLLIAQAMVEPLRLVTSDAALARYSDLVLPV